MAQTYNLGKVAVTPKGEFSLNTPYTTLDLISYNGSSYLVTQPVFGILPPNPSYFMLIASKGDAGAGGMAASIAVGAVESAPAGTSPSVSNSGTTTSAILDFVIPGGNAWHVGNGITGTSATPTVFASSGVLNAGVGDMYLNTSSGANGGNVYRCVTGGNPSIAQWVFSMSILGVMDGTVMYSPQESKTTQERLAALSNVGIHVGNKPPSSITTEDVPVGELYAYFTT